jgi:hypothetical protein
MDSLIMLMSEIEIVPGRDHGNLLDEQLIQRLDREIRAAVADLLPPKKQTARD